MQRNKAWSQWTAPAPNHRAKLGVHYIQAKSVKLA